MYVYSKKVAILRSQAEFSWCLYITKLILRILKLGTRCKYLGAMVCCCTLYLCNIWVIDMHSMYKFNYPPPVGNIIPPRRANSGVAPV